MIIGISRAPNNHR